MAADLAELPKRHDVPIRSAATHLPDSTGTWFWGCGHGHWIAGSPGQAWAVAASVPLPPLQECRLQEQLSGATQYAPFLFLVPRSVPFGSLIYCSSLSLCSMTGHCCQELPAVEAVSSRATLPAPHPHACSQSAANHSFWSADGTGPIGLGSRGSASFAQAPRAALGGAAAALGVASGAAGALHLALAAHWGAASHRLTRGLVGVGECPWMPFHTLRTSKPGFSPSRRDIKALFPAGLALGQYRREAGSRDACPTPGPVGCGSEILEVCPSLPCHCYSLAPRTCHRRRRRTS